MRRINAWLCNYATPVAAGVNGSARNDVAVPLINLRLPYLNVIEILFPFFVKRKVNKYLKQVR